MNPLIWCVPFEDEGVMYENFLKVWHYGSVHVSTRKLIVKPQYHQKTEVLESIFLDSSKYMTTT